MANHIFFQITMGKTKIITSKRADTDRSYNLNSFFGQSFVNNFRQQTWFPPKAWWTAKSQHLEVTDSDSTYCFTNVDISDKGDAIEANQTGGWRVETNTLTPYKACDDGSGASLGTIVPGATFLRTIYQEYRVTSFDCTLVFSPFLGSTLSVGADGVVMCGAYLSNSTGPIGNATALEQAIHAGLYKMAPLRISTDRSGPFKTASVSFKNVNVMDQFQAEDSLDQLDPDNFTATLGATQAGHGNPPSDSLLHIHPFLYVRHGLIIVGGAEEAQISIGVDVFMTQHVLFSSPITKAVDT